MITVMLLLVHQVRSVWCKVVPEKSCCCYERYWWEAYCWEIRQQLPINLPRSL